LFLGAGNVKKNVSAGASAVTEQQSGYTTNGQKNVFNEDVDAFVLDDDQDPFGTPEGNKKLKLVDEDVSVWSPEDRKGDFETIYYDFDRATLRADQRPILQRNVEKIKNSINQGNVVVLEGHACKAGGSAVYNMALSTERAQNVNDYLTQEGVPADKLKVVGRGSEMCKVASGNKEQQAPNRRVDMYVVAA